MHARTQASTRTLFLRHTHTHTVELKPPKSKKHLILLFLPYGAKGRVGLGGLTLCEGHDRNNTGACPLAFRRLKHEQGPAETKKREEKRLGAGSVCVCEGRAGTHGSHRCSALNLVRLNFDRPQPPLMEPGRHRNGFSSCLSVCSGRACLLQRRVCGLGVCPSLCRDLLKRKTHCILTLHVLKRVMGKCVCVCVCEN